MQGENTSKKEKNLANLTVEELKIIIDDIIDAKFEEWFGDPDEGLEVREEIIEELNAQRKSRRKRIPGEEVIRAFKARLEE